MSTYEIAFYAVMGAGCVLAAIWGLRSSVERDPTPVKAYWLLSFSLCVFCLVVFLRLSAAWGTLSDGWRFLAGVAFGLFSTAAAIMMAQSLRLRRHRRSLAG